MFDTEVQEYVATLRAFRDNQAAAGTPTHRAVSAALKLLEREPAVQSLLKAVNARGLGKEIDALIDAVAKQTP